MIDNHFLKEIFIESKFSKDELKKIISKYQRVDFSKNDYFINEETTANYYYFIESGFARSYVIDLEGNDITTKFFAPKDIIIDWHSFFLKTKSKENLQALSTGVAWKISFENFMQLFSIEAFREVGRTRLVNNYFELKNHSLSIIIEPAKDRYLHLLESKPDLINNVPLKQIATYLGITDTSLSRIRKEIADKK